MARLASALATTSEFTVAENQDNISFSIVKGQSIKAFANTLAAVMASVDNQVTTMHLGTMVVA